MIVNGSEADNSDVIWLDGRLSMRDHHEFRAAYNNAIANPDAHEIRIDFGGAEYVDSSALGMLLLLRESASVAGKTVSLANVRGRVREVINIANLDKLFDIR